MWTWPSMMPGTTVRPLRSMTRVFGARAGVVAHGAYGHEAAVPDRDGPRDRIPGVHRVDPAVDEDERRVGLRPAAGACHLRRLRGHDDRGRPAAER